MELIHELFPINRSILGDGVRTTLNIIKRVLPDLNIHSVASGTAVYDWTVPLEWKVNNAYIETVDGVKLLDFEWNHLHLMQYSTKINEIMSVEELFKNVHMLKDQPSFIPYITSYYTKNWGFCMEYDRWTTFFNDPTMKVRVVIDTDFIQGELNYGELNIIGKSKKIILLSTYICHPSLYNDNLSGIVVTIELARWLQTLNTYNYSYRILFLPETIGSITYLATQNRFRNIIGGYTVTCVGREDPNYPYPFTYLKTRKISLTDKISQRIIKEFNGAVIEFNEGCGSDERQYNYPGISIPIGSIMRTPHSKYPEYHTSGDNMDLFSENTLQGSIEIYKKCITLFEINQRYTTNTLCEPFMSKYNLYPEFSVAGSNAKINRQDTHLMMSILRYSDGNMDIIDMANKFNVDVEIIYNIIKTLLTNNLIRPIDLDI